LIRTENQVMNHTVRFSFPIESRHESTIRPLAGFMACPMILFRQPGERLELVGAIYQEAFREALAVIRPSILERNLCWN
jgi:hypothetical protein